MPIPWEVAAFGGLVTITFLSIILYVFYQTKHDMSGWQIQKVAVICIIIFGIPMGIGLDMLFNWLFKWDLGQYLLQIAGA